MHTTDHATTEPKVLLRPARRRSYMPTQATAPSELQRARLDAGAVLQRQRQLGNKMVQRLLAARKATPENGPGHAVADYVETEIQRARGAGQALDAAARAQMEPALGADLGNVRVHADQRADNLNQALDARAFTTGQDVFFRQGQYAPGSSDGRELLAHELTHVVQQGEGVHAKLTVGAPDDEYEQEADQVAHQVMRQEQQPIQRQPEEDTEQDMPASIEEGGMERDRERQP